jgi:hypothetical protein
MMPGFNANDYTTVAERLTRAADQLQTIIAEPPVMLTDAMGYIRATVALKDGRTSTGTASFRLDLQGNRAQATNPIEDCETSAIGRALGMLGYGSSKSVASREEIHEAERRQQQPQRPARTEYVEAPTADATAELKSLVTAAREANIKLPVSVAGKVPSKMTPEQIRVAILDLKMAIERAAPVGVGRGVGEPVDVP